MSENMQGCPGRIWLERGIAAARAGKRLEARQALFRALNDESQREMAWLWLAAVSDDVRQERLYLEKVLSLNPDNPYAKAGLAQIEKREATGTQEVVEAPVEAPPAAFESRPVAASLQRSEQSSDMLEVLATVVTQQTRPIPLKHPAPANAPDVAEAPVAKVKPAMATTRTVEMPRTGERALGTGVDPSGWTAQTPNVSAKAVPPKEPSGWTVAAPLFSPQAGARLYGVMRSRRPFPSSARGVPRPKGGGLSLIVNEVLRSHETWTVMAAAASLGVLGLILVALAVVSLLGG